MNKITDFYKEPQKKSKDGRLFNVLTGGAIMPTEAQQLHELVGDYKPKRVLEVGTGLGGSAIAIGSALEELGGGALITLDPFQEEFGNIGITEVERIGLSKWVEFRNEFAEDVLYSAFMNKEKFDFLFLDGAHSIGVKMTHTFFADRCLKPGGIFAFHDVTKPCTAACVRYLVYEREYSLVKLPVYSIKKTMLRMLKYNWVYGRRYGMEVIPAAHLNLVVLRKKKQG